MSSKVPFVKKEIAWLSLIPRLLYLGLLCLAFYPLDKKNFFIYAIIVHSIITFGLRKLAFPAVVHSSVALIKEAKFEEAIPYIKESIDYYDKRPWIDKYRFLLMVSSSKQCIMELLLCNLAFCHLQIGDVKVAKLTYEEVLSRYPENPNARVQLQTINAVATNPMVD
jgi:tetratricopeptide (TPR) repeat protein